MESINLNELSIKIQEVDNCNEAIEIIKNEYIKKLPYTLVIELDQIFIKVNFNKEETYKVVKDYFREFLISDHKQSKINIEIDVADTGSIVTDLKLTDKVPDPGKTKIKEAFHNFEDGKIILKKITGVHFLFTKERHLALGPCFENFNQVVNFVNNRFIDYQLKKGMLLLHASGITQFGRGVAMCGFSGAGKSTLALHIMNKGTDFVSNDRILFGQRADVTVMLGVAKYPRINPGTIINNEKLQTILTDEKKNELNNLSEADLWDLEEKYDAFIDSIYGVERFNIQSKMDALIILNWQRNNAPLKIEVININEREDLFPAFVKTPGVFFIPESNTIIPDLSYNNYKKYLKDVKVIEITGGIDFAKVADIVFNYMKTGNI